MEKSNFIRTLKQRAEHFHGSQAIQGRVRAECVVQFDGLFHGREALVETRERHVQGKFLFQNPVHSLRLRVFVAVTLLRHTLPNPRFFKRVRVFVARVLNSTVACFVN